MCIIISIKKGFHTCTLHFHSKMHKNDDVILACPLASGEYDLEAGLSHHNASLSHSAVTHLTFTKKKQPYSFCDLDVALGRVAIQIISD